MAAARPVKVSRGKRGRVAPHRCCPWRRWPAVRRPPGGPVAGPPGGRWML